MTNQQQQDRQQQSSNRQESRSGAVREKALDAYDGARQSVAQAGRRTSDSIEQAPLIALGAGIAAGALIAALLPRTQAEEKLLGPVGDKLSERARAAAEAAREAGKSRLQELGLTPDAARDKVREVAGGIGDAAKTSAQAAAGAAKGQSNK